MIKPSICLLPLAVAFALQPIFSPAIMASTEPGGGSTGSEVTLTDQGTSVVLSNGIISATIDKSSARIPSYQYKGQEMTTGHIYYSMDGGKSFTGPGNCDYSVKIKTPEMVDLGFKSVWKNTKRQQAFDMEVHYVLRRGNTGVYTYAMLNHPADYPATGMGEWRMVWKLSNELMEKIYVDDARHWRMPTAEDYKHAEKTGIAEITKFTTGAWAGRYDCKYSYSVEYRNVGCWGHASDTNKIGAWIVMGGFDFLNDGPTKQDLSAASGINHIHFGMDHFGASSTKVEAGEAWQKIYGPFLLYCNSSDRNADAMWADAKQQVQTEIAAWPYAWLTDNPAYPTADGRGRVTGRLIVTDPLKPAIKGAGAWIGVAQPDAGGDWQFESKRYQYWVKAGADGSFTIPDIRPGTYTFYAFTDGVVGEFSKADVKVAAKRTTTLGDVAWNVVHPGASIAWEIGIPNRSAKEFRHGNDYFEPYKWDTFAKDFSNPLVYTIGTSKPETDWNYAQSALRVTGSDGKSTFTGWNWKVNFNLSSVPTSGNATLTVAIASTQYPRLFLTLNDDRKPFTRINPRYSGGNALLRQGIHAKYSVVTIPIPVSKLKLGPNTFTFNFSSSSGYTAHVMYDYLSLELPASQPTVAGR